MKKIIMTTLILMCILGATIASADVKLAETGPYDVVNGKKLLFYGDTIQTVQIRWWNASNTSQYKVVQYEGLHTTSYVYTISNNWSSSYILWFANMATSDTLYHFEGGFSTIDKKLNTTVNITSLKNWIATWFLTNQSYLNSVINQKNDIITSLSGTVTQSDAALLENLKTLGLTDAQITTISDSIEDGFKSTLKSKQLQEAAVNSARDDGYWSGITNMLIIMAILITVAVVFYLVRGNRIPIHIRNRKQKEIEPYNLDNVFGVTPK